MLSAYLAHAYITTIKMLTQDNTLMLIILEKC